MRKERKLWLGEILFFAVNWGIYCFHPQTDIEKTVFHWASLIVILLLCLLLWAAWKWEFDPIRCFLPIALVTGLLYSGAVPAFRGADEELHFYRAYEISCGHIGSENRDGQGGRELPADFLRVKPDNFLEFDFHQLGDKLQVELHPEEKAFIAFNTAAVYSPVQYLPQAAGIAVGRLFRFPPIALVYCGRIGNLLFWIFACYVALRWLRGAPVIYLLGLLPSMLHSSSVLSADGVTTGLILLFVTDIIRLAYFERERQLSRKDFLTLFGLGIGLSLCKIVYVPFCFLILLLPRNQFASPWHRKKVLGSFLGLCLFANLAWTAYGLQFLNETNPGVDGGQQLIFILTHPIRYLGILLHTVAGNFNFYLQTVIGANFCLFDVPIYIWITNCYLLLLGYLAVFHNPLEAGGYRIEKQHRRIALGILITVFVLIHTSLYIQWNPVGVGFIDGMQGRYFTPFLCLLPFFFRKRSSYRPEKITVCATVLLAYPIVMTLLLKHI